MEWVQFERTRLLVGEAGLAKLRATHVAVVGCGAVGSFAIEALARTGVGRLTLVDGDVVSKSNINRQLCALHSTVGQAKVEVLRSRISDICPETVVDCHNDFVAADNCDEIFKVRPDFVIDAIDVMEGKVALIRWLQHQKIPFISSMGAALKTDFTKIRVALLNQTSVCPLAAKLRKILKTEGIDVSFPCVFSCEQPVGKREMGRKMGSLVSITGMFGLILANEVIKRIVKDV